MTDGNNGDLLKITKSQHNNFGESSSIKPSSTWQKLFPPSRPANDDMELKGWYERVYGLALQRSGLR
eukprot:2056029-Karenia_brevis.AAC.1